MSQNENSNLKRGIKTQLKVIENLPKSENRSRENSVTNKNNPTNTPRGRFHVV